MRTCCESQQQNRVLFKKKIWTVFLYTFLNILNAYREYKSWYFKPNSPQENYKEFKHSFTLPTLQSSKINKVKMLLKGLKLVFAFTTNNKNDELAEKKNQSRQELHIQHSP